MQVGVTGVWPDGYLRRFIVRMGLQQHADKLVSMYSMPVEYSHIRPSDLAGEGIGYWDAVRLIASFQCAARRQCPPVPVPVRDESLVVARAMQWDAETLARFLEGEGRGLVATAAVVRREGISGFVFASLGRFPDGVRRLGVGLSETSKIRPMLSTGPLTRHTTT